MGYYTHISTCFSLNYDGCIPKKAKEYASKSEQRELKHMFDDMSNGKGFFVGSKGSLFNWGYVGNYTEIEPFVEMLKNFLEEIRGFYTEGFLDFDQALVFYEPEQSEQATAYEIKPKDGLSENKLIIEKHNCPFAWMQM